jgi:protein SCO1/2
MTSLLKRPTLAVVLTALIAACGGNGDDGVLLGYEPPSVTRTADVTVTEAGTSAPFRLEASAGGILIVFFGFTNCPDVCPATLAAIKNALRKVDDDLAARVDVAMITVDPDRDTAETLPRYLGSFLERFHALIPADDAELRAAEAPFGATSSVIKKPDGSIEVGHGGTIYVVDDEGNFVLGWPFGLDAESIAHDIRILLDRNGTPT